MSGGSDRPRWQGNYDYAWGSRDLHVQAAATARNRLVDNHLIHRYLRRMCGQIQDIFRTIEQFVDIGILWLRFYSNYTTPRQVSQLEDDQYSSLPRPIPSMFGN